MRSTTAATVALIVAGAGFAAAAPASAAATSTRPAAQTGVVATAPTKHRPKKAAGLTATITLDRKAARTRLDGRAYLLVAKKSDLDGDEPRDHIDVQEGIPFWGKDVSKLAPGRSVVLAGGGLDPRGVVGNPIPQLNDLPKGEYVVQTFFNQYETAKRSDGSRIMVHFPCGDGGDIWHSPGNLYSAPVTVKVDPAKGTTLDLRLTNVVKPSEPVPAGGTCQQGNPATTQHVKHVKIRSKKLSKFWGRDIYIAADVLLPKGYDDPKNAGVRYPMEVIHGHYPKSNPNRFDEKLGNDFSKWWMSDEAPRFISVVLRTENPFYDDSYVIDSANIGPYGTAFHTELLPAIDKQFRTIGQPWARVMTGGSTGGWVSLANQLFHPELFGGTWSGFPDAVDFHAHQVIDLYNDKNVYYAGDNWAQPERPAARGVNGDTWWTTRQENHCELAQGTKTRGMGQWDVWNAAWGPQGKDGYPAEPWDKVTGEIDPTVVEHWKRWDLTEFLEKNWSTVGPKVNGKIHVYVGEHDNYFLDGAVHMMDARVQKLSNPAPDIAFTYGPTGNHGWSPWTKPQLYRVMADHIAKNAPAGTDTSGWIGTPPKK